MKMISVDVREFIDRKHDVVFDNVLAYFKEHRLARGLVTRQGENRSLDLLLRDGVPKMGKIMVSRWDGVPIDALSARIALFIMAEK